MSDAETEKVRDGRVGDEREAERRRGGEMKDLPACNVYRRQRMERIRGTRGIQHDG